MLCWNGPNRLKLPQNKPFTKVLSEHASPRITFSNPQAMQASKRPGHKQSQSSALQLPQAPLKHETLHQHPSALFIDNLQWPHLSCHRSQNPAGKKAHLRPQQRSHSLGGHSWPEMSKEPWHTQNEGFKDLNMKV